MSNEPDRIIEITQAEYDNLRARALPSLSLSPCDDALPLGTAEVDASAPVSPGKVTVS